MIFASYWGSPPVQFSKFNNFLWACWSLCKNLSNFVPLPWKIHNPYCHNVRFRLVSVRETELWLTCSVRFWQNGKTLLRSVTTLNTHIKQNFIVLWKFTKVRSLLQHLMLLGPHFCTKNEKSGPNNIECCN